MPRPVKQKPPSKAGLIIAAIFFIGLGTALGFYRTLQLPVKKVEKMPEAAAYENWTVYWLRGEETGGSSWQEKRTQILEGYVGEMVLTEAELNRWVGRSVRVSAPDRTPTQGEGEEHEGGGFGLGLEAVEMLPQTPNFRITSEKIYVGLEVAFPNISPDAQRYLVAQGSFQQRDGTWQFVPQTSTLAGAPFGQIPGLNIFFHQRVINPFLATDEAEALRPHWERVTRIELRDKELVLTFGS